MSKNPTSLWTLARRPAALAALALLALGSTAAQALDLQQAWDAANTGDATIRAARAATEAARERLPQARAQLRPNVSFSAGRNYNDLTSEGRNALGQPVKSQMHYYSGNQVLQIRQPLYRPYNSAQVRQAEAQVAGAEAELETDEQALVVRVGEAYFEALLAREQLALVLAQKHSYSTQLDAARKALAAGSGTRTDIDDAQARLDMTVAQELEARQNEDYTRRRLEVMTGQPVDELARVAAERFAPQQPVPALVDDWIERAEDASPQLRALRAQVETARQEVAKARTGHLPTLDAVAQWSRTISDSVTSVNQRYDNKTIGLQLQVPLYAGGYVSSTVRQALAMQTRAEEQLEAARLDLGVRVHREFRGMTEGVLRIAALQQAVASAEQALASSRKSQEAGVRTLLDVLNAEQQRILALRDLAQARYLYLVSRLRLQSLAGEDAQDNVAQVNVWLEH